MVDQKQHEHHRHHLNQLKRAIHPCVTGNFICELETFQGWGQMKKIITLTISIISGVSLLIVLWSSVQAVAEPDKNTGMIVDEGSSGNVISNTMLMVSDTVEVVYVVNTVPAYGFLRVNGTTLTDIETFTQSDIDNKLLTYDHDGSETPPTDYFTYTIQGSADPQLINQPFTITITPVNDPPTANPDTILVLEGGTATSTAEGGTLLDNDTDPDDSNLIANTNPISAPNHFTDTFSIGPSGSFSYKHDDSENLNDEFVYEVCDDDPQPKCDTITATIIVTGVVDIPPILNVPTSRFSVEENSNENTPVGNAITSTDVEVTVGNYDTLTYTITGGNTGQAFGINGETGQIVVSDGSPLNYENESTRTFTLTVQVKDKAGFTDTGIVYIDLIDVNEDPKIDSGQVFSIPEDSKNNDPVGTVEASDPDEGDNLTYSIISGSNPGGTFDIDPDSGLIYVANETQLDYDEGLRTYSLNIQVRDDGTGNKTDEKPVTVNITGVNEHPTVSDKNFSIDENSINNTPVGAMEASDPEVDNNQPDSLTFSILNGNTSNAFTFVGSNLIVNNSDALNYESPNNPFTLTVQVSDSGNLTDTATITVSLNDINEPPVITPDQSFTIPENSANDSVVDTVVATDEDTNDNGNLTFEITDGNSFGTFSINNNGVISVLDNSRLNHEEFDSFTLAIKVTDSNWDGLGAKTDAKSVEIIVGDVNENPSVASGQSFTIVGFSKNGTEVGIVSATDPDDGDTIKYAIADNNSNPNNAFAINEDSGKITVNNRDALDFDVIKVFNLKVRVTDKKGLSSNEQTVVINLTEPPIYIVHIPLILNNYRPDEPNDACSQSYAIQTDLTYSFLPENANDWYKFTLSNSSSVNVVLSNFQVGGQILAYGGSCGNLQFLKNNGNFSSTKTLNLGALGPGTYYIWVISEAPFSSNSYNLVVNTQ